MQYSLWLHIVFVILYSVLSDKLIEWLKSLSELRVFLCCCIVVFMGSREYPGENTFDSFLSKHGGHSNASTDYEKVHTLNNTENHGDNV